jgi:hypothetical protein
MLDYKNFWINRCCTFIITLRDTMHALHSSKELTENKCNENINLQTQLLGQEEILKLQKIKHTN